MHIQITGPLTCPKVVEYTILCFVAYGVAEIPENPVAIVKPSRWNDPSK